MKTIKVIFLGGAFAAVICVLLFFFLNKMFRIEEEKGTASLSTEIPYLGKYLISFPSQGKIQYVIRKQMSTYVVSWAGKMMNPESSKYFDDPKWSISITKFNLLESPIKPVGDYKIAPSPDDEIVMCYKPIVDANDKFRITVYYMPINNIFIGEAISSRPD